MPSIIDDGALSVIQSGIATEAAGQAASRTRSWDSINQAISVAQVVNLGNPTVLTGQGIRMLNGTPTMAPGNAPNTNAGT